MHLVVSIRWVFRKNIRKNNSLLEPSDLMIGILPILGRRGWVPRPLPKKFFFFFLQSFWKCQDSKKLTCEKPKCQDSKKWLVKSLKWLRNLPWPTFTVLKHLFWILLKPSLFCLHGGFFSEIIRVKIIILLQIKATVSQGLVLIPQDTNELLNTRAG